MGCGPSQQKSAPSQQHEPEHKQQNTPAAAPKQEQKQEQKQEPKHEPKKEPKHATIAPAATTQEKEEPKTKEKHTEQFEAHADEANQVGGHGGKASLFFEDGKVLKPNLNPKELAFYKAVAEGKCPLVVQHKLTPAFHGLVERDTQWGKIGIYFVITIVEYIVMEDVTKLFKHPSVLDMKMGTQTWDEDCNPKKKDGHIQRDQETTSAKMGFRFCGMKVFNSATQAFKKFPKNFGWDCHEEAQMKEAIATFIKDGEKLRIDVIAPWLEQLEHVREFMMTGKWRFHAASLLFIYDEVGGHEPMMVMIDFAHAWEIQQPNVKDEGFLIGVDMLSHFFKSIYKEKS